MGVQQKALESLLQLPSLRELCTTTVSQEVGGGVMAAEPPGGGMPSDEARAATQAAVAASRVEVLKVRKDGGQGCGAACFCLEAACLHGPECAWHCPGLNRKKTARPQDAVNRLPITRHPSTTTCTRKTLPP